MRVLTVLILFKLLIFISAKLSSINTTPSSNTAIKNCVETIQKNYLTLSKSIIAMDFEENFINFNFPIISRTLQNLSPFVLFKADAYILIMPQQVENLFKFLVRTPEWNPRGKFIIIIDKGVDELFRTLKKYYVVNVAVLFVENDDVKIYTYFPYDFRKSEEERNEKVYLGACLEREVSVKNNNLFSTKLPRRWHNLTVKTALMEYPPYVICSKCEDSKKTGLEIDLFQLLARVMEFHPVYLNKTYKAWGAYIGDHTFTDALGDIQNGTADVGIGMFYANSTENWYLDASHTYLEDASKWIVPTAKSQSKWESITKTFTAHMWLLILATLIIVSSILCAFCNLNPETKNLRSFPNCLITCFKCLVIQAFNYVPNTHSVRLILALWIIFGLWITVAFQSKLVGVLNVDFYEKQISNVRELIESKIKFGFSAQTASLFTTTGDENDNYIYNNFEICSVGNECIARIIYKGDYATIKTKRYALHEAMNTYFENGRPRIYIFEENLYNVLIRATFTRGFPIFEQVNEILVKFKDYGFVDFYYRRNNYFIDKAKQQLRLVRATNDDLSFHELQGVFGLLLLGWFSAFLCFFVEICIARCAKKTIFQFKN